MSLPRLEFWGCLLVCAAGAVEFLPVGAFFVHLLAQLARAVGGAS
jgi:hypothetical protein